MGVTKAQRAERRKAHEERFAQHQVLTLDERIAKVEARGGSKSELKRLRAMKEAAHAEGVET